MARFLLPLAMIASPGLGAEEDARVETPASDGAAVQPVDRQTILVVVGAEGAPEYAPLFAEWARKWREAARQGEAEFHWIGPVELMDRSDEVDRSDGTDQPVEPAERLSEEGAIEESDSAEEDVSSRETTAEDSAASGSSSLETDRQRLLETARRLAERDSLEPLWIVLIGHGTFDGQTAKFNLRGPDVSAEELRDALATARRPRIVINGSSSSSPFVNVLSGPQCVVVTATRSGFELNYARFGGYLADSITNSAADLDKDDQVSLLEAFLHAAGRVAQFYSDENRLATEHAILDDNGDGLGTPAEWFQGVRAVRGARDGAELDGNRARRLHLVRSSGERALSPEVRQRRDELEEQLETLRGTKSQRDEDDYYRELEVILVELARIYRD